MKISISLKLDWLQTQIQNNSLNMVDYFHFERLIFLRVIIYLWIVLAFCVKIPLWYHKDDPPVWKGISHPQRYYILSRNSEFSIQRLNFSMGCTSKGLLLDSNKGWIKCWQLFQHFGWSRLGRVVKTKFKIFAFHKWPKQLFGNPVKVFSRWSSFMFQKSKFICLISITMVVRFIFSITIWINIFYDDHLSEHC